jgi:hypothetical protein
MMGACEELVSFRVEDVDEGMTIPVSFSITGTSSRADASRRKLLTASCPVEIRFPPAGSLPISNLPPTFVMVVTTKQGFDGTLIMVNGTSVSSPVTLRNGDGVYFVVCSQDSLFSLDYEDSGFGVFTINYIVDPDAPPAPPAPLPPPPSPNAPGVDAWITFFFKKNGLADVLAPPLQILELPEY